MLQSQTSNPPIEPAPDGVALALSPEERGLVEALKFLAGLGRARRLERERAGITGDALLSDVIARCWRFGARGELIIEELLWLQAMWNARARETSQAEENADE